MNRQAASEAQRSEHKAADEAGPPTSFLERGKLDNKSETPKGKGSENLQWKGSEEGCGAKRSKGTAEPLGAL
jgi:hypothetical protein